MCSVNYLSFTASACVYMHIQYTPIDMALLRHEIMSPTADVTDKNDIVRHTTEHYVTDKNDIVRHTTVHKMLPSLT